MSAARLGEDWCYVYLLLEFQSQPDPWMALRLLVYVGLLYQELVKGDALTGDGHLPPVLPLVLYNGSRPWAGAEEISALIHAPLGGLERYRPKQRFLLIDEGRLGEEDLPPDPNLAAALMRLERADAPPELARLVGVLAGWLHAPEQAAVRRGFTGWLRRVLLPQRLPEVSLPELNDLEEVSAMLADRVVEWTRQWREEGLKEGLKEGRHEGEALLLRRLLERRFGPLDAATAVRLAEADDDQLLRWADRVLAAGSLEDVFVED